MEPPRPLPHRGTDAAMSLKHLQKRLAGRALLSATLAAGYWSDPVKAKEHLDKTLEHLRDLEDALREKEPDE